MNNKKILFISHNLELEGATWSLFFLVNEFKKKGYIVNVVSPQGGPLKDKYSENKIPVSIGDISNMKMEGAHDAFFVNTILGYKFINNLNEKQRRKTIWCIRESEREMYFKKHPELQEGCFDVRIVVFVSETTKEIYQDLELSNNFAILHNGIDCRLIDKFRSSHTKSKLRRKYGFDEEDLIVNITGTVCLRKGQKEFVEAAILLLKKTEKKNVKFIVVGAGRGGDYEQMIRKTIKANNFENRIFLVDETRSVFDYYQLSDIFVCNSYIESFPRVVLEAMAFELPIIATRVYGICEQIENEESGILIMAGDVIDLERKLELMIDNKKLADELAINGRKRVMQKFSFEEMSNKYLDIVKKICAV